MSTIQWTKPEGSTWTDDQWTAIAARGRNLLVAAAAGSGKTAVLVERIIRRIADESNPVDVDRLLVATFTKAAAAEMRHRIREALEKALTAAPESEHLRKQLALIGRSSITTLHSFCMEVIQRHYQMIGLDPGFRIANETEAELMRQDVLEELLEEHYGNSGEDSLFWSLVDRFSGERSDEALYRLIQKLYDESRSHATPNLWLSDMADLFHCESLEDSSWISTLLSDVGLELEGARGLLQSAITMSEGPGGPLPYVETLKDDLATVEHLEQILSVSWEHAYHAFQGSSFGKLKPVKGDDVDKEVQEAVKELRNLVKKVIEKLKEDLFGREPEQFISELRQLAPVMKTLVDLIVEFGDKYSAAKKDKGLLDFADLEHYCLRILRQPDTDPNELLPSVAAEEYREQFEEVLLDEYQDTNRVQEAIVELISRPGTGNRFMVGDVKQSIYRFRLAEPGLFLEKYKSYSVTGEGTGWRIDLARNFRSRQQVVDGVNVIFKQVMNEKVGEISYDDRAELVCGASYPEVIAEDGELDPMCIEMMLIDKAKEEKSAEGDETSAANDEAEEGDSEVSTNVELELETAQLEARAIGAEIRKLMGMEESVKPFEVFDKRTGGMRPVMFRDMVILLRATSAWSPVFIEELKQLGIPAYADLNTGYFTATEIETMMSLLKIIDNPYQDISFAAVLRSPILGLTADEMAQIRIHGEHRAYFDAAHQFVEKHNPLPFESKQVDTNQAFFPYLAEVAAASEAGGHFVLAGKLGDFLNKLDVWRTEARRGALSELIWKIYRETGFYDFTGGMPGGLQRQANLRALYDRAKQYEATSLRGLFRFLRFIERMKDSGGDLGTARALGEQEDVVRIMSIHKSKGLEFPVVFVGGLAKMFNQQDLNGSFLIHKELGFGPKFVDPSLRIAYPTLPMLAIRRRMRMETLAEEMRILYVALTRAREKLYLTATVPSLQKLATKWMRIMECNTMELPDFELSKARSYLDWMGPSLIRHPHAKTLREIGRTGHAHNDVLSDDPSMWKFTVIRAEELQSMSMEEIVSQRDEEKLDALKSFQSVGDVAGNEQAKIILEESLTWSYPYPQGAHYFAKTSVSEMKRLERLKNLMESEESVSGDLLQLDAVKKPSLARRPRFMEQEQMNAAERGTVYHSVMQLVPVETQVTLETVNTTLRHMVDKQLITVEQRGAVNPLDVLGFFESDLGKQVLLSPKVHREVPFSYGLKAEEAYDAGAAGMQETVLIQGVIDCLVETDNGLLLIDYKTDAVRGNRIEELKQRYELQLRIYSRAIEEIWKKPVVGQYLYFFDGRHVISMGE